MQNANRLFEFQLKLNTINLREELGLPYLFRYSVTNRVEVGVSPNKQAEGGFYEKRVDSFVYNFC